MDKGPAAAAVIFGVIFRAGFHRLSANSSRIAIDLAVSSAFMDKDAEAALKRAARKGPDYKVPNPEMAAREVLRYLLTYAVFTGRLSTHGPELITPEDHKKLRGSEKGTWGITWEEGPSDWAVRLSTGSPMEAGGDSDGEPDDVSAEAGMCDTTRQGCYAEPHYGFDLFWWPTGWIDDEIAKQSKPSA